MYTNPAEFTGFILKHLRAFTPLPIKEFHQELISLVQYPRIAIAAPRSFAKSTYFSLFYPLYVALEKPGSSILMLSATGALAEAWLTKIRRELENNPSLLRYYGKQNEAGKWATDELQLANGSVIMAKGAEKQIRGFRPDVVIGDDLETDEMVLSADRRTKFDEWFSKDVTNTLRPNGQFIVVGTLLHPESFLADVINKGRHGWETRLYRALKEDKTSTWPEAWSTQQLTDRKEEIGVYAFEQEYMNNPIPEDLRKFQKVWIHYFDQEPKGCVYFTVVDPAIEVDNPHDYTAIVTVAVDQDANIYVVETINKRYLPKEMIDTLFDVYRRWDPVSIGIEAVGFQKLLKYEIQQERNRRKEYPVIVELASGGRRKWLRIEALQPRFENGKIFIKPTMKELETQLLAFPSTRSHDDIIDALAYVLDVIRPAGKEVLRINPECFVAHMEKRRGRGGTDEVWGNQALRDLQ